SLATADTLAKFDAASIVVPEIRFDMTAAMPDKNMPPMKQSAVYRDLRLEGIKAGKAAKLSSAGMTEEITGPAPVTLTMGAFHATDYDLPGIVRFLYGTAAPGEAPKPVTGPATIEGAQVKAPEGVEVSIGKMAAGATKLRPLASPVWGFVNSMA